MNTELLQRLSKAAPEFIQDTGCGMFRIGILEFGESKSGRLVEVIKGGTRDVEWQLFGAICEKANAEGWTLAARFSKDGFCVVDSAVRDGWEFARKPAWEAVALALLEILDKEQEGDLMDEKFSEMGDKHQEVAR